MGFIKVLHTFNWTYQSSLYTPLSLTQVPAQKKLLTLKSCKNPDVCPIILANALRFLAIFVDFGIMLTLQI